MGGSDDERTKKKQGVPPAKAAHSHPEGNVVAMLGTVGGEVNGTPFGGNCCMYACA